MMHFDDVTFLWKDPGSGHAGCPALYEVDGGYLVQGNTVDDETRTRLRDLAEGEDAVFVPAAVLDLLKGR
jgi:hypothetical protein